MTGESVRRVVGVSDEHAMETLKKTANQRSVVQSVLLEKSKFFEQAVRQYNPWP